MRTTHASTTAPRMEAAALKSGPRIHRAGRAAAKAVQGDKSHFQFRRAAPPKERPGDRRVPLQPPQKEKRRRAHLPRTSLLIACIHFERIPVTHPRLVIPSLHSLSCDSPGRPPRRAVVVRCRLRGGFRPSLQQLGRRRLLGGAGEAGSRSDQRRSSPRLRRSAGLSGGFAAASASTLQRQPGCHAVSRHGAGARRL